MKLEHNSRKSFYRYPKGAVKTDSSIRLRISIGSIAIPDKVSLFVNEEEHQMYYIYSLAGTRIYECRIKAPAETGLLWYFFKVEADGETNWYSNNENFLGGMGQTYIEEPAVSYQITVYDKNYKTPDWIKNAVVYQIFPDRFYRGEDTPIHGIPRSWGEEPFYTAEQFGGEYLSNDFFGGTLSGIAEKLPYLKDLGVTAIYLNPIFEAFSNHRYDTGDYENVDKTLGTNEDFINLAKKAKKMGIRIILDGVFSHTGADSRYFNKYGHYDSVGAYQSEDSPYYSWYNFHGDHDHYDSWWGFDTLPNTNELDSEYVKYILTNPDSIIKRWIENGASGWRLDVADELPDEFIIKLRKAVKEKDKNALVIGEVWEDASNKISYGEKRQFLLGKSLDGVMNYVFRGAVLDYLKYEDSCLFTQRIMSMVENYPAEALYASLNLISTHDVPRALTILSDAPDIEGMDRNAQKAVVVTDEMRQLGIERMKLATLIQFTLPGAPCVYYGDEIGMYGYADPFNRRCFNWENINHELRDITEKCAYLHGKYDALKTGMVNMLYHVNSTVCYLRYSNAFGRDTTKDMVLVCINASQTITENLHLEMGRFNFEKVTDGFTGEAVKYENHYLDTSVPPLSAKVFILKKSDSNCCVTEYI
ncbi:MAG: glycoside hydrolase family 13 protein [Clostridia bacterium]